MGLGILASAAGAAAAPGGMAAVHGAGRWPDMLLRAGMDALPGCAAWLVWRRPDAALHRKKAALRLWGWGLPARALLAAATTAQDAASVAVPGDMSWRCGMVAALLLCGLTVLCFRAFWPLQRFAAAMLLPYMACIGTAAWLGASV